MTTMIPVISIVGKSNSGKTTLIERLIPCLKQKGYRVGAVKHNAHRFEIDHEGKDSWRMTHAGADTVVVSSVDRLAMVKVIQEEISLRDIANWLFKDVDLIIAEGYKSEDFPKIEVIRFQEPVMAAGDNLIALVDNFEGQNPVVIPDEYAAIPKYAFEDVAAISELIVDRFLIDK